MAHPHSNLVRQVDNVLITTDALAAITGVLGAGKIDTARLNGFRTLAQRGFIQWSNSDGSGGPVMVGFCEAAMTLAELEEAIENDPQSSQDTPAIEQAGRKYYLLGYLSGIAGQPGNFKEFATKHKASYIEGNAMNFFAYNCNTATALDASNQIKVFCEHLGVWLRD